MCASPEITSKFFLVTLAAMKSASSSRPAAYAHQLIVRTPSDPRVRVSWERRQYWPLSITGGEAILAVVNHRRGGSIYPA
eukprot:491296-Prorocentrum_minimum.AAC.1